MTFNYRDMVNKLLESNSIISNVVIADSQDNILYQTDNWDVSDEIKSGLKAWHKKPQFLNFYKIRYSVLQATNERLITVNLRDPGFLVGAKSPMEIFIMATGNRNDYLSVAHAFVDVARLANTIREGGPYIPPEKQFVKYSRKGEMIRPKPPIKRDGMQRELKRILYKQKDREAPPPVTNLEDLRSSLLNELRNILSQHERGSFHGGEHIGEGEEVIENILDSIGLKRIFKYIIYNPTAISKEFDEGKLAKDELESLVNVLENQQVHVQPQMRDALYSELKGMLERRRSSQGKSLRATPPPPSGAPPSRPRGRSRSGIKSLRDDMLQELGRLKDIMRGRPPQGPHPYRIPIRDEEPDETPKLEPFQLRSTIMSELKARLSEQKAGVPLLEQITDVTRKEMLDAESTERLTALLDDLEKKMQKPVNYYNLIEFIKERLDAEDISDASNALIAATSIARLNDLDRQPLEELDYRLIAHEHFSLAKKLIEKLIQSESWEGALNEAQLLINFCEQKGWEDKQRQTNELLQKIKMLKKEHYDRSRPDKEKEFNSLLEEARQAFGKDSFVKMRQTLINAISIGRYYNFDLSEAYNLADKLYPMGSGLFFEPRLHSDQELPTGISLKQKIDSLNIPESIKTDEELERPISISARSSLMNEINTLFSNFKDKDMNLETHPIKPSAALLTPHKKIINEIKPIIIDLGTGYTKIGFVGEDEPRFVLPTIIGHPKFSTIIQEVKDSKKEYYIGESLLQLKEDLKLIRPLEFGIIQDFEWIEKYLHYIFFKYLKINPADHPVMITEPPLNPRPNREKISELLFENFNISGLYTSSQPLLSLYSIGSKTGCVVEIGEGVTHVVPIYEGFALSHAIRRSDLAGWHITDYLQHLLRQSGFDLPSMAEFETVREIKENLCYIALDPEEEVNRFKKDASLRKSYKINDQKEILVEMEQFLAPEILFNPSAIGHETESLENLVLNAIMACDPDLRGDLSSNILLTGGTSRLPGLKERLTKELKTMIHTPYEVKILQHPKPTWSVWLGGSILGALESFQNLWITREEYKETGPYVIHRCF